MKRILICIWPSCIGKTMSRFLNRGSMGCSQPIYPLLVTAAHLHISFSMVLRPEWHDVKIEEMILLCIALYSMASFTSQLEFLLQKKKITSWDFKQFQVQIKQENQVLIVSNDLFTGYLLLCHQYIPSMFHRWKGCLLKLSFQLPSWPASEK